MTEMTQVERMRAEAPARYERQVKDRQQRHAREDWVIAQLHNGRRMKDVAKDLGVTTQTVSSIKDRALHRKMNPMPLSARAMNCLANCGLSHEEPQAVASFGEARFLDSPNFGLVTLHEVKTWLRKEHGLELAP
jgi:DNA-directed RNA polymerase alpha subunit